MKISNVRMMGAALAMSLGLAAGNASALPSVPYFSGWTTADGVSSGFFGHNGLKTTTTYTDTITIGQIPAGNGNADVTALKASASGIVDYFKLYDFTTSTYATVVYGPSTSSYQTYTFSGLSATDTYQLKVGVHGSNSYSGNIAVAAVPEPETYAMLLAGLGLVGFTARRRKNNA